MFVILSISKTMEIYEKFRTNQIWVSLNKSVAITNNITLMKLNSVVLKDLYNNLTEKNFATLNRNMLYFATKMAKNSKNEPN